MADKATHVVGSGLTVGKALARTAALGRGSAEVIGRRVALGALAPATPEAGAEAARLVPEKAAALSAGALAGAGAGAEIALRAWTVTLAELDHAGRAAAALARARTPMAAGLAQANYAIGLWGRMAAAALMISGQTMRAGMVVMAPAQRVVLANARRLRAS